MKIMITLIDTKCLFFCKIADWSLVLSMGEQQRLSFARLLALFTLAPNKDQLVRETLVFLDESTSAIDINTEHEIYQHLTQLCVWFVTISHRSSLVHLHTKWLQFFPDRNCQQTIEQKSIEDQNENKLEKQEKGEVNLIKEQQFQVSFIPFPVLISTVSFHYKINFLERQYIIYG